SGLGFTGAIAAGGASNLYGYGVELDTYGNDGTNHACGETVDGHHVNVHTFLPRSTAGGILPPPPGPPQPFPRVEANWHPAPIPLSGGKLTVAITQGGSEVTVLSGVTLTGFTSGTSYYFGFAGSTGQFSERAELRNFKVVFPTARCL